MKQILHSIQPILIFCKFFGFLPLNVFKLKSKKSTAIYFTIVSFWTVVWIYIFYERVTVQYGQAMIGSSLSRVIYYLCNALMLIMMTFIGVNNFLKREKIKKFIEILAKVDKIVRNAKIIKIPLSIKNVNFYNYS